MRSNLKTKQYRAVNTRPILVSRFHARMNHDISLFEHIKATLKGVSMLAYLGISVGTVFVTVLQVTFTPSSKMPLSAYSLELKVMHSKCLQRTPTDPECDLIKKMFNKSLTLSQEDSTLH